MRPILHLIAANDEDAVVDATTAAFATADVKAAFEQLCSALRGVGPATASYVLAAHRPAQVPVFSDEGFRWVVYYGYLTGLGSAVGDIGTRPWGRKIKYGQAEYWDYYERTSAVVSRLELESCEDVERAGFVLGQEAAAFARSKSLEATATKDNRKRKSAPEAPRRAGNGGGDEGKGKGTGRGTGRGTGKGIGMGKGKGQAKGEGKAGGGGEGDGAGEPQKDGRKRPRRPMPTKKEALPPRTRPANTAPGTKK